MSPFLTLVSLSGLLDLALKSAAVMLLAVGIAALLGKASAARRHLLWCLSVASLLLLPALSLALPAWQVAWLPQWTTEPARLATATQPTQLARTGQTPETQTGAIEPVVTAPTSVTVAPPDSAGSTAATEPLPATNILAANPQRGPLPWLAIGWATGALLSLVPLAVGLWQLAALHRRSRVIGDPCWLKLLDELRRQLAVRQSVELRQCEAALARAYRPRRCARSFGRTLAGCRGLRRWPDAVEPGGRPGLAP
ncbi:MAG: hypothetical protein WD847_16555 [Pirellulales bacterium]